MSEIYRKICKYLNYVENNSAITGCVSIFALVSLGDINVCISSSSVGINICAIIAGIKNV